MRRIFSIAQTAPAQPAPDAHKGRLGGRAKKITFFLTETVNQYRDRVDEPQHAGQVYQMHSLPFVPYRGQALLHTARDVCGRECSEALGQLRCVAIGEEVQRESVQRRIHGQVGSPDVVRSNACNTAVMAKHAMTAGLPASREP